MKKLSILFVLSLIFLSAVFANEVNEKEFEKLNKILDQIGHTGNENIITIDACNNKRSASNVK